MKKNKIFGNKQTIRVTEMLEQEKHKKLINKPLIDQIKRFGGKDEKIYYSDEQQFIIRQFQVQKNQIQNFEQRQSANILFQNNIIPFQLNQKQQPEEQIIDAKKIMIRGVEYDKKFILPRHKSCPFCGRISSQHPNCQKRIFTSQAPSGTRGFRICLDCNKYKGQMRQEHNCVYSQYSINKLIIQSRDQKIIQMFEQVGKIRKTQSVLSDPDYMLGVWQGMFLKFPRLRTGDDYKCMQQLKNLQIQEGKIFMFSKLKIRKNLFLPQNYYQVCKLMGVLAAVKLNKSTLLLQDLFRFDWTVFRSLLKVERINYVDIITSLENCTQLIWYISQDRIQFLEQNIGFFEIQQVDFQSEKLENIISGNIKIRPFTLKTFQIQEFNKVKELMKMQKNRTWVIQDTLLQKKGIRTCFLFNLFYAQLFFSKIDLKQFRRIYRSFNPQYWFTELKQKKIESYKRINYVCDRMLLKPQAYADQICQVQKYLYNFKSIFNFWRKIIISWKESNTNLINLKGQKYTFQQRAQIYDFIKFGTKPKYGNYYKTCQIQEWANYNCFLAYPICRWEVKYDHLVQTNKQLLQLFNGYRMNQQSLMKRKKKLVKLHEQIIGLLSFYRKNYGNKIMQAVFKQFQLIIVLKRKARVFQKYQQEDNQRLWRYCRQNILFQDYKNLVQAKKLELSKQVIKKWQTQIIENIKKSHLFNFIQRYKIQNNCQQVRNYKIAGLNKAQNQFIKTSKQVYLNRMIQSFISNKILEEGSYNLEQKIKQQLKLNFYQILVDQRYLKDLMEFQFYQDPTFLLLYFQKQVIKKNRLSILHRTQRQMKLVWRLAKKDIRLVKILFNQKQRLQIFKKQFQLFGQNPLLILKQDLRLFLYAKQDNETQQITKRKTWCLKNLQIIYNLFIQQSIANKCLRQWIQIFKNKPNQNGIAKLFQLYERLINGWSQLFTMIFRYIHFKEQFLQFHRQLQQQQQMMEEVQQKIIDHVLSFSSESISQQQIQLLQVQQKSVILQKMIDQQQQIIKQKIEDQIVQQPVPPYRQYQPSQQFSQSILSKKKMNEFYQQIVLKPNNLKIFQDRIDNLNYVLKGQLIQDEQKIKQLLNQIQQIYQNHQSQKLKYYVKQFYQNSLLALLFSVQSFSARKLLYEKYFSLQAILRKGFAKKSQIQNLYKDLSQKNQQFFRGKINDIIINEDQLFLYNQLQKDVERYTFNLKEYVQQQQIQRFQKQVKINTNTNTNPSSKKKGPCLLVYNNTKQQLIREQGIHKKVQIASIIKILVFLVVQDMAKKYSFDIQKQEFPACHFQEYMQSTAKILSKKYTIYQYLIGMIVPSGCDATYNIQTFFKKKYKVNLKQQMKKKAKELDIKIQFQQVAGCHKTLSTLSSVLVLFKQALKSDIFNKILTKTYFNNKREHVQSTSLQLIKLQYYGKTGTSDFINGSHYVGYKMVFDNQIIIITQGMYNKSTNFQFIQDLFSELKMQILKQKKYQILELERPKNCFKCNKIFNYNVSGQLRGQCSKCSFKIYPKVCSLYFSSGAFICQKKIQKSLNYLLHLQTQTNNLRKQITKRFPNSKIIQNFIYVGQLASKKFYCNADVLNNQDSLVIQQSILNWEKLPLLDKEFLLQRIYLRILFWELTVVRFTVFKRFKILIIIVQLIQVCPEKCINHGRFFNGQKKVVNMSVNRTFFMFQQKLMFGLVCLTNKSIKKGQEIRWRYGINYWKNK